MSKVYFLCFLIPTDFDVFRSKVISSMFSTGYVYLLSKTKLLVILFGFVAVLKLWQLSHIRTDLRTSPTRCFKLSQLPKLSSACFKRL
jgi:hypothetical protein